MLYDLFPRVHERYERSRFSAELDAFAVWLSEHGHLRHPLRLHLRRAKEVLDQSDRFRSGEMFHEEDLRAAFVVAKPEAYLYQCTGRIFTEFLAATKQLIALEHSDALSVLQCRYQRYLAEVRGLSVQSLKHHGSTVTDLLARGLPSDSRLFDLTVDDIETYVQRKSKENSRASLQHVIAHLRAFLRYCADQGEVAAGLDIIDTPRVYRGELPPRALDWTTVRKLLASIRRCSPRDRRDYAILHWSFVEFTVNF